MKFGPRPVIAFFSAGFLSMGFLSAPVALGEGGSSVRGGGSVVEIDGKWTLSDLVVPGEDPSVYRIAPKLRGVVEDLRDRLGRFADAGTGSLWNEILGPGVTYRFVESLPCPLQEDPTARDGEIPFGCTIGETTYLLREPFEKLDSKQKILALIHERAHARDASPSSHDWIHPMIRAMSVFIDVSIEQSRGIRRKLRSDELDSLRALFSKEVRAGMGIFNPDRLFYELNGSAVVLHPFGGGALVFDRELVDSDQVPSDPLDPESFLSVDSSLVYPRNCDEPSSGGGRDVFIESSVLFCFRGSDSRIEDSSLRIPPISLFRGKPRSISIDVDRSRWNRVSIDLDEFPADSLQWTFDGVDLSFLDLTLRTRDLRPIVWSEVALTGIPSSVVHAKILDRTDERALLVAAIDPDRGPLLSASASADPDGIWRTRIRVPEKPEEVNAK